MTEYPAGKHTVGGTTFQLYVDDHGHWRADAEGYTEAHGGDRKSLENQLKVKVSQAKVRVDVPFVKVTNMNAIRGRATGIDARTGGVTIRWDDGSKSTTSRYEHAPPGTYLQGLSDGDLEELVRLLRAHRQAQADLREFTMPHSINLPDTVHAAVDAAREAQAS